MIFVVVVEDDSRRGSAARSRSSASSATRRAGGRGPNGRFGAPDGGRDQDVDAFSWLQERGVSRSTSPSEGCGWPEGRPPSWASPRRAGGPRDRDRAARHAAASPRATEEFVYRPGIRDRLRTPGQVMVGLECAGVGEGGRRGTSAANSRSARPTRQNDGQGNNNATPFHDTSAATGAASRLTETSRALFRLPTAGAARRRARPGGRHGGGELLRVAAGDDVAPGNRPTVVEAGGRTMAIVSTSRERFLRARQSVRSTGGGELGEGEWRGAS